MKWSRKTGQQKLNFKLQSNEKAKRQFSSAFKAEVAMEAIKGVVTLAEIAYQYEIHPAQVSTWKKTFLEKSASVIEGEKRKEKK